MITQQQIENLKYGDKLIFFRNGYSLSCNKGNVFTFSNWKYDNEKEFWQCCELLPDNPNHSFAICNLELFDEKIHLDFNLMNKEKLNNDVIEFNKRFKK